MIIQGPFDLWAEGSTTTGNGAAITMDSSGDENPVAVESVAVLFNVSAVGATPTITGVLEGTLDNGTTWFAVPYVTEATDTIANTALTVTTVSQKYLWMDVKKRPVHQLRFRISANTNVTFGAHLYKVRSAQL